MTKMLRRRGGRGSDFEAKARERREKRANRGSGRFAEGQFDRLPLSEDAIWVYFPPQAYTYEVYDSEEGEVVQLEDYPYYEFPDHFIPAANCKYKKGMGRGHTCSAGPHKNQPCYSCKKRELHFEWVDRVKDETGKKPKDKAPVSRSNRIAMSTVCMERILKIPVMQKNPKTGKMEIRKSQAGNTIHNLVPAPASGMDEEEMDEHSSKYGHRFHVAMSGPNFDDLTRISQELKNFCANCCSDLKAIELVCPECDFCYTPKRPIKGEDLLKVRETERKCKDCGTYTKMIPILECTGCEEPEEGRLIGCFDLRLKATPRSGDQKGKDFSCVEVRLHGDDLPEDLSDEDIQELEKMCENPLDIKKIYAPSSLEAQRKLWDPELIKDVDPSLKPPSKSYSDDEGGEDEEMDLPDSLK